MKNLAFNLILKNSNEVKFDFTENYFFVELFSNKAQEEAQEEAQEGLIENKIRIILKDNVLSKAEIAKKLGHVSVSGALKKAINNLIEKNQIELTIPKKPKSKYQKYKLIINDKK